MKIDLDRFETIEKQTAQVKEALQLAPEKRLRLTLDATHALNDILRGMTGLFPHKRSTARLGMLPTPVQEVVRGFAGEGIAVQEIPVNLKAFDEEAAQKAFDGLKKDTLFIVASIIEPLTGQFYPFEWLRARCAEKNIFLIAYAHSNLLIENIFLPETLFEAFVYDPGLEETTLSFWVGGERFQNETLLWGKPHFRQSHIDALTKKLKGIKAQTKLSVLESVDEIKRLESDLIEGISGLEILVQQNHRLTGRMAISIKGSDGSALTELLSKKGHEVTTASACHWDSPHLHNWLLAGGFSADDIQTSLIISKKTVLSSNFKSDLKEAINYLRKFSGENSP